MFTYKITTVPHYLLDNVEFKVEVFKNGSKVYETNNKVSQRKCRLWIEMVKMNQEGWVKVFNNRGE